MDESTTGDYVTLKWGTIKSYRIANPQSFALVEQYFNGPNGMSISAMPDWPDEERQEILCRLIESIGKPVYLEWDGEYVSVEKAQDYVRTYGKD